MPGKIHECQFDNLTLRRDDNAGTVAAYAHGYSTGEELAGDIQCADLQRFANPEWDNDLQRARREGFEAGSLFQHGNPNTTAEGVCNEAARRYPLRVLRSRQVVMDGITISAGEDGKVVLDIPGWARRIIQPEVIAALHDLSSHPQEWADDTTPEHR